MFANERYKAILTLLEAQQSVTVTELTERFGVSTETVRRDLAHLEAYNKLLRVHGGAMAIGDPEHAFAALAQRVDENVDKKRELCETAMRLIREKDVIAVDTGSTAIEFATILAKHFQELTVVTYSKDVLDILAEKSGFCLRAVGGDYVAAEHYYGGFIAEETLRRLHVSKCFIFPSTLSLRCGVAITIGELYNMYRGMIGISDHTYVLADSSKFESNAPIRICELDEVDAVVTDSALDRRVANLWREKGIELIMGEE
ncbi:MAG: DeoR/GlpR transcriptional regulator [Clostridia bacterium]|nr:DeoR/GlpR transcriptional regulator [Clostridia bacterium]